MLSVGPDPVLVERMLVSGELICPDCGQRLAPWGHAALRFVRVAAELVRRIRPRRGICSGVAGCGRSHVLLPRFCLGRRVDAVSVIWAALLARAMGQGWRRISEAAGRPASTVRGWLARFAAHAEPIRVAFAQLERHAATGGDLDRLAPIGSGVGDAVGQIGAACAAVRRRWGSAVFTVSAAEMVAACSGGWLLAAQPPAARRVVDQHVPASVNDLAGAARSAASLLIVNALRRSLMSAGKKSRASRARDIALYRYALIRPLADPALSPAERGKLVRELAAQVHIGPFGEPVTVSRASLDRWIRTWRAGGFDALIPAERQVEPRTEAAVLELAERLKRERPARTAAHIARIIEAEQGWAPTARTLQRHFARRELNTRPDGTAPKAFGRFEATEPDELWVTDGLHGPIIEGKRAVLFALLDDHSRYVVGHRWGHGEDTLGMQAALHDAVKTHGCPARLYCDNGSAYSSAQLAWSAAVLDIKIVHSAPGRPQGRGKIERWNRTVRDQFLVEIDTTHADDGSGCVSLAELNRLFTAWLHQQYHRSPHSETGATPAERYHAAGRTPTTRPDPALLRRAFLWREQRKVTSFATVSLHGNRYEVEAALIGRTIDLLFTPFDLTIIEVEYQGRPMGRAIPHQVTRHVHPAVKPDATTPVEATGIDYLRLLEGAHHTEAGQAINFTALTDEHPGNEQDGPQKA